MAEEKLKVLGILTLILLGFVIFGDNPTHYCESTQIAMTCARTTAQYCYPNLETRTGSKRCVEGWQEIPKEEETPQIENIKYNIPSGGKHHTKDGCIDC